MAFFYCAETRASHRIMEKLCKQTCSNLANEDGKLDAFGGLLRVSWWHLRKHFSIRSHEVHVLPDSWFTTSKHLNADEMGKIHFDASCWFKGWVAKVGFLRRWWHLWLLWWFRMLRVVDTLWTSRNLNPIWLCDGHHYIIVNTQTNNVYTPSFLATDLKHLILYFEFTIFWTKCFGFLSFSATFWHQLQPQPGVFSMFL